MGVPDASDSRLALLTRWVVEDLGFTGGRIETASADASFRRYFRLTRDGDSYIVMDAPPEREALKPFISIAQMLAGIGLNVPVVMARDMRQGFLLLSDLGSRQYLDDLIAQRDVERLYADALRALTTMQTRGGAAAAALPAYDDALLLREMELMPDWFLGRHLGMSCGGAVRALLDRLFAVLVRNASAQPATFVHRDYHSRNLLVNERANPGILDFQDAVYGPVTYDLVSLLKDCYIAWPPERVTNWALQYREQILRAGFVLGADEDDFVRWFDLMGLQRHIKVLGIFARLYYRDGKSGYLRDLPRVLEYTRAAASLYPETREFADYIALHIDPRFDAAQTRERAPC
jgi:N-acetylmuramate 1-kinase